MGKCKMKVNLYQTENPEQKVDSAQYSSVFRWYLRGSDPSQTPEANYTFGLVSLKSSDVLLDSEIRTDMNYTAKE